MKLWNLASGSAGFTVGAADNDLLWTSPDLSRYDNVAISTDNPADVESSIDGGLSWQTTVLSLEDVHAAAAVGTRVLTTAAGKVYRVAPGYRFSNIRVRQNGAGAVATLKVRAWNSLKG